MLITIDEVNGFVVVIVIGIFVMVFDIFKVFYALKELRYIITFWDIKLRNRTATQSEIIKNIMSQSFKSFFGFLAIQYCCRITVFADDVRFFSKIIFKIPRAVVTPCGDNKVKVL